MPNPTAKMPDAVENGSFIPRLDNQGAIWLFDDEVTKAYLAFAAQTHGTMLEISAGYGHLVIKTLEAGATKVSANESDPDQLAIIKSRVPAEYANRLVCCLGAFPEQLEFPKASFDGIYSARLLHFFNGDRIRSAIAAIHNWLRPGGQVFLVNDSVYRTVFKPLIPVYEKQVASGAEWPGVFADVRPYIPDYLHPEMFPKTMNFLDPNVLTRELERAGFQVLQAKFYPYTGNFALGRLDDREIAGAIAEKVKA